MEQYTQYFEKIQSLFSETYESAGGQAFRYFHSVNVANIAAFLSEKIGISPEDKEIVVIAAIFHDVAKFLRKQEGGFLDASHAYEKQNNLESHEQQSAEMVMEFLSGQVSEEKIKKIFMTIINHSNPSTLLEMILHDADELSEMGSMNVWKMFTYSANKKRDLENTLKYWFEIDRDRHLDKRNNLFLDLSKEEADRRINMVDEIFGDLQNQLNTL
jgi:putative nucleotidyltransferase with HDIG domain